MAAEGRKVADLHVAIEFRPRVHFGEQHGPTPQPAPAEVSCRLLLALGIGPVNLLSLLI